MKDQCMFCGRAIDRKNMVKIFNQNGKTVMVCPSHEGVPKQHEKWLKMLKVL